MFFEFDFYSIFVPAIIIANIFIVGFKFWEGKKQDELEKAISLLKINFIVAGFLLIVLWFMLPSPPALTTFGVPETIAEIQSDEQLLNYLQEHNKAIVRTTRVVHWVIFIFVWVLLITLYSIIKSFKILKEKS